MANCKTHQYYSRRIDNIVYEGQLPQQSSSLQGTPVWRKYNTPVERVSRRVHERQVVRRLLRGVVEWAGVSRDVMQIYDNFE